jgi:hypothetical protein
VLIVTKQKTRSQSLLYIVGTEHVWCTVLSQSLSTDVFIEILGHVTTTNMMIIYVICIYNLFVFCAGILERLVPCIWQRSSPSPERRIKENTTQGQTGSRYEGLIQEERRQELKEIWDMILEEESSHRVQFDGISIEETEQGKNLCLCVHYS